MGRKRRRSPKAARRRVAPVTVSRRGPRQGGLLLLLALAAVALGLLGGRTAGGSLGYATGLTGARGQLTVERCWGDHPNKPHMITSCAGAYRSDDGRLVLVDVPLDGRHAPGDTLPVQYGDGAAHAVGAATVAGDLAGLFAVAPLVLVGVLLAVRSFAAAPWSGRAVRVVLWCSVGCLVVAGLCLLGGVASSIAAL